MLAFVALIKITGLPFISWVLITASCGLNISQVMLGISLSAHLFPQVVPTTIDGVVMCSMVDDLRIDSSNCFGLAFIVSSRYREDVGIA